MTEPVIPGAATAAVHVLSDGYVSTREDGEHVGSTVTLITDGDRAIVVDPGMVASRAALLAAIAARGVAPGDVTDMVFSHHHPDHTINAALFPNARIHDHWAIYDGDLWIDRPADGYELSPSIRLLATPGHTRRTSPPSPRPRTGSTSARTPGGRRAARPMTRSAPTRPPWPPAAGRSWTWPP